jgi:hypothetical protein
MSTGAFKLSDIDPPAKPIGQFTAADLDSTPPADAPKRGIFEDDPSLHLGAEQRKPRPGESGNDYFMRVYGGGHVNAFEGNPENLASYVSENANAIGGGTKDIVHGDIAKGAHKIIGGVMGAAAPILPFAGAAAPVATGLAMAGGYVGKKVGQGVAQAVGATPDQQALAGDVGGIAAGFGAAKIPAMLRNAPSLFRIPPSKIDDVPPVGRFNPALANTPREIITHAASEGIDLTPAQATQMPTQRMVQAIGERSLIGAKQLTQGIDRNAGAFMDSVRKFADTNDPKAMGLSEESAGEAIKQSAQVAKQVSHDNASDGYKQIDYLMPEKVSAAPIANKWNQIKGSFPMGAEDSILAQVPRDMRGVVQDMFSGKPEGFNLTFEQGIKLRSVLRELGDTDGLPNSQQAGFKQLTSAADSALETGANKIGAADQWRSANAGWKDYIQKYGDPQSPLAKILKTQDPKQITNGILNRGSAADVETLKNEGMDSALDALKRQVIEDVARNKFNAGRNGIGGYSDSFIQTLFGPDGAKDLYLKGEIGRRFNWQQNPSGTSNVMSAYDQVTHPEPGKLMMLPIAAKASMPRPAASYLPGYRAGTTPPLLPITGVSALLGSKNGPDE